MNYYNPTELQNKLNSLPNYKTDNREYELKDIGAFLLEWNLGEDGHVVIHHVTLTAYHSMRLRKIKGINNTRLSTVALTSKEGYRLCNHLKSFIGEECYYCDASIKRSRSIDIVSLTDLELAQELKILAASMNPDDFTIIAEALVMEDRGALLSLLNKYRETETDERLDQQQDQLDLMPTFRNEPSVKDIGGILLRSDITSRFGPTLVEVKGRPGANFISVSNEPGGGGNKRIMLTSEEAKTYCSHRKISGGKCLICDKSSSYSLSNYIVEENLSMNISDVKTYINIGASHNMNTGKEMMILDMLLTRDFEALNALVREIVIKKNLLFRGEIDEINSLLFNIYQKGSKVEVAVEGLSRRATDYVYTQLLGYWKPKDIKMNITYNYDDYKRVINVTLINDKTQEVE